MSYRHLHETTVDLPPERLYAAIVQILRWPEWDTDLRSTEQEGGPVEAGAGFALTPKGGPRTRMQVTEASPPSVFADVAHLPLARMHTRHVFERVGPGETRMCVTIETRGPLAFLWDRIIARKQAKGAAEQARAFQAFARSL